ncbi:MAG: Flagellar synthesis regulator FleN [Candidatus Ozemobacter sibiricus]|jgi:MinD-like ATPase involved in chromosome partitioning or flagellar assembly|uniref:Flagellar synthesis regulator FleN n=1 Tax=Candidatus Ozemobacter sibiricus TaxID=2268124 RepID=A0A367ZRB0_9BACT|nr:MAG: Flagellar synthesis regulator FleN [Candidatus Ozemobacter sibiricus]
MFALKGFSESDFEILRKHLVRRTVAKNEVIVQAGQNAQWMHLVEEGSVKIVQRTAGGDEVVLGAVKAGGFFGEEALLGDQQQYLNTAVAMESTTLMSLSKDGLQKLMVEAMGVGTKLLLALTKTYREALATPEQMAKVITFYTPKGGAGNTTLAVNFACQLARQRKKVAFLDCDLQFGNAHLLVGAPPHLNLARLIQKEETLVYDRIKGFLDRRCDVDFLHAPEQPQEAEMVSRSNLNQILRALGRQYDFLVLDAAPHIDDHTLLLWDMADLLMVVSPADLAGLTRLHRLFKVLGRLNYPKNKFVVLANRFRDSQQPYLAEFNKLPVGHVHTIPDDVEVAATALFQGVPFMLQAPTSGPAQAVADLVRQVLGEDAGTTAPQQKGGIFSRLRSLIAGA